MLAYPGPRHELKDQLGVEAFVDSLDDPELEIRVKDRFPKNLAEAFQTAIMLEANQIRSHKDCETKREKTKSYRPEIEARRVNWSDDDQSQKDLIVRAIETYQKTVDRSTDERKDAQFRELQHKIQAMEVQNRNQQADYPSITPSIPMTGVNNQQNG